jgi:hypothetical protein
MTPPSKPEMVNSPGHYTAKGTIECIEAIEAQLTTDEFRGFLKGNIAKYVWRELRKGGQEDLRKAQWYLNRLVERDDAHRRAAIQELRETFGPSAPNVRYDD